MISVVVQTCLVALGVVAAAAPRVSPARPRLVVTFPAYNEELRLPVQEYITYAQTVARTQQMRLLFVDDGSTDGTVAKFEEVRRGAPDVVEIMVLSQNRGKAEAIRQGMLRGLEMGADFVGFWDSDLATPLTTILSFQDHLANDEALQMAFGARVALLGRNIQREASRHYLGRVFATLASMILDLRIYDTQCGAKMFRASPELEAVLATSFHSRWIFDVELIARFAVIRRLTRDAAHKDGKELLPSVEASIYEHPLEQWTDIKGSKLKFRHQVGALYGLAYIWWTYFSYSASWPQSIKGIVGEDSVLSDSLNHNLAGSVGPEGDRARGRFRFYLKVLGALGLTVAAGVLGILWLFW